MLNSILNFFQIGDNTQINNYSIVQRDDYIQNSSNNSKFKKILKLIEFKNLNTKYSTPLTCSGLGEKDILVCPFDDNYIKDIQTNLNLANKCIIKGKSGTGKSLLTYQVAKLFYDEGWSIYKIDKNALSSNILTIPSKKILLLVDDAQTLSTSNFEELIEITHENCLALFNWNIDSNDNSEFLQSYPCVDIVSSEQVEMIKKYSLKNKDEITKVLKEINVPVNEKDYRDNIENRIEEASYESTPWLFNYLLTEGWRKAQKDMKFLSDDEQLDLVMIVVAFFQIGTLDKGVEKEVILNELSYYNNDERWLTKANQIIDEYCINDENIIYHKHYLYAKEVLYWFDKINFKDKKHKYILDFIKRFLTYTEYEYGYSGFLEYIMFHYKYAEYILTKENFISDMTLYLFDSSIAKDEIKIKNLNSLIRFDKKSLLVVSINIKVINQWILSSDKTTVLVLKELINTLYNEKFKTLIITNKMLEYILSKIVTSNIIECAKFSSLYNKLHMFSSKEQKSNCSKNIEQASIAFNISNTSLEIDAYHFTKIINNMRYINENWSQQCVYKNLNFIANAFNKDILKAYSLYGDLIGTYFGVIFRILNIKYDNKNGKLAKKFTKLIKIESILEAFKSLTRFNMQDFAMFLIFIYLNDEDKLNEISNQIDYQYLKKIYQDDINLEHWHKGMLRILYNPEYKPYQEYIAYLIDKNEYLEELLIALEPDLSEKKLKEGKKYKIHFHGDDGYKFNLALLKALDKDNSPELSFRIIESNKSIIEESIFNNISNADKSKDKYDFLVYLFHKNSNFLRELFENKEKVDKHIKKIYTLLRGKKMEKKIGNLYLFFIKEFSEIHQEEIKKIKSKFPSTRGFSI